LAIHNKVIGPLKVAKDGFGHFATIVWESKWRRWSVVTLTDRPARLINHQLINQSELQSAFSVRNVRKKDRLESAGRKLRFVLYIGWKWNSAFVC